MVIFFIYLLIGILDNRISMISRLSRPITEFFLTYVAFFIGFCCVRSFRELNLVLLNLAKMLSIVCLYGILTFFLQKNPLYDLISLANSENLGIWSEVQERGYRVCSFFNNPIVYGGAMGVYSLIIFNVWHTTREKALKYLVFIALLISVVIANSRTGMITTFALYLLYYLLRNKISYKNCVVFCVSSLSLYIIYSSIGVVRPMIDSALDLLITGGANSSGSTMDLKEQQWATSVLYFSDAPYFGHGLYYFPEVMGNKYSRYFEPLIAGMEGYQYKILIEQGGFMAVAVVIFYIQLLFVFFKNRSRNITIAYTGIACMFAFLFFICSTGTYGSTFLHFGVYIGILLRCVYDKRFFNTYTCI